MQLRPTKNNQTPRTILKVVDYTLQTHRQLGRNDCQHRSHCKHCKQCWSQLAKELPPSVYGGQLCWMAADLDAGTDSTGF